MTAYEVRFYGGPLAEQVHMIDNPPVRYQVPSFTRPRYTEASLLSTDIDFEVEDYELGPGSDGSAYTYTWINPAKALREAVRDLRATRDSLEGQNRDLQRRLAEVQKDANRWKTVQGAIRTLKAEM